MVNKQPRFEFGSDISFDYLIPAIRIVRHETAIFRWNVTRSKYFNAKFHNPWNTVE